MPNGKEYEELIATLTKKLLSSIKKPFLEIGSGSSNKLFGYSKYGHQIDIHVDTEDVLYIIEAKHWADEVNLEAVLVLFARCYDIWKANKKDIEPILVSTKRATWPAEQFAKTYGINLAVVENIHEYSIQFGSDHFAGLCESVSAGDALESEVIRAKDAKCS
jgi:hypothetical protein